jgi:cobalamin synthase
LLRLASYGILRLAALVETDVLEERIASIIRVTRIGEQGTLAVFLRSVLQLLVNTSVVPSSHILVTLMVEALRSSETSVLTRATRSNTQEDGVFHRHRREYLKSYVALTIWAL